MSNPNSSPQQLDLEAWVDLVAADPVRRRQREVIHILLHAIARTPALRDALYLKGGTLMSAAYRSMRQTGDVDFTATVLPEPFSSTIRETLDTAMAGAAADLAYVDLVMKVQKVEPVPKGIFQNAEGPGLKMTIGLAVRGTAGEKWVDRGNASEVVGIDISFKEPVINVQVLGVDDIEGTVLAYSVEDLIAEKLRALAQQEKRNRTRRQDVFDIAWLIEHVPLEAAALSRILDALRQKAEARGVPVNQATFDDPELRRRAEAEWGTMKLELGELPDFGPTFEMVRTFYRDLPW